MAVSVSSTGQAIHEFCVVYVHRSGFNRVVVGKIGHLFCGNTTPTGYDRVVPMMWLSTSIII